MRKGIAGEIRQLPGESRRHGDEGRMVHVLIEMIITDQAQFVHPGGMLLPDADIVRAFRKNHEVEADGCSERQRQPKPGTRTQKPAPPPVSNDCFVSISLLHNGRDARW
jgi:hypothetical protein